MILESESTPTITRTRTISGISADIENLLLETGTDYSMRPYINNTVYNDIITLDPSDYLAFANDMTNVKLVIWNKGPSGSLSPDEIDIIKNTENVNHFICGDGVIGSLVYPDNLSFFGLEFIGWNLEAQGSTFSIRISGQEDDVITGDLGENIEGRLIQYYVNLVRITDTENVFPIMHFRDDGFRQYNNVTNFVSADNAIFGVRSTKNNTRTVLLGISPYIITDVNVRRTLVNNILDWLVSDVSVEN
ncbi:MAG TPA: hypothetical protein VMW72_23020 [Sedimentisphaerales bacterium]|nr:hypothetical protein [Sedimentisphaerales bacterium]